MRADSPGGRIVGATARDTEAVSSAASISLELPGWTEQENTVPPGRRLRLRRSSMLGRIVAALARTETRLSAVPFTPALQEDPTQDAELKILFAGQQPARKPTKARPIGARSQRHESLEPTPAARLAIKLSPA
jgi:hypothetical protein